MIGCRCYSGMAGAHAFPILGQSMARLTSIQWSSHLRGRGDAGPRRDGLISRVMSCYVILDDWANDGPRMRGPPPPIMMTAEE